ncbi:MAG: CvpA family protein [Dehalococcoidia bacterium]|nr:MAG: CvpA family protein [Dehalococcoidia bacterium]UCG82531.1 MAG: CvpA family protein [Dehalococcoidia bacterium]
MNWMDVIIIVLLVIPAFIGFKRGLAKTFLPLLAVITGVIIAGIFYGAVSNWLSSWLHSPLQANIVAFILIFILTMIVFRVLFSVTGRIILLFHVGMGGLANTVLPLVVIIVGVALAGIFYDNMADLLSSWLQNRTQATIAGFMIVFILVMVTTIELYLILSSFTGKYPRIPIMGWVDSLGGIVFGLVIGGIISGAVLSVIAVDASTGMSTTIKESALASVFLDQFPFVLHLLPSGFREEIDRLLGYGI